MKFIIKLAKLSVPVAFFFGHPALAGGEAGSDILNPNIITAVAEHYDISSEQAIDRLAKETELAIQYHRIKGLGLDGYAGAWINEADLILNVATNDTQDLDRLRRMGVNAVVVDYSLHDFEDLLAKFNRSMGASSDFALADGIKSASVSYESNTLEIVVSPSRAEAAALILAKEISEGAAQLGVSSDGLKTSSGPVRAADGQSNYTWDQQFGGTHPCSIGASISVGYLTAGHCGYRNHIIRTSSGQPLGTVRRSTWPGDISKDSGFVKTVSGQNPTSQVNGYSDGIFTFTAEYSGTLSFPVGSTVCRYGATSQFPDCGQIYAKGLDVIAQEIKPLSNVTSATGICTDSGDSGGPYISGGDQMQGTNIGGITIDTCPTPTTKVYYQPVMDTVNQYTLIMLTAHGANKPTLGPRTCPNFDMSGAGYYECQLNTYNSQGITDIAWSTNTGASSTSTLLSGYCNQGVVVTVAIDVTNPYGTTSDNWSFNCPSGPIP